MIEGCERNGQGRKGHSGGVEREYRVSKVQMRNDVIDSPSNQHWFTVNRE